MSDAEKIARRSEDLHELQKTLSELQEATAQEMRKAIAYETRRLQIYKQISNRLQEECAPLFEKYGGPDDYRTPSTNSARNKRPRVQPKVTIRNSGDSAVTLNPQEYYRKSTVVPTSPVTERRQSLRSRTNKSPAVTVVNKNSETQSVPSNGNGSSASKDLQVATVSNGPITENFATSSVMTVIPTSSINSVTTNGPADALFEELSSSLEKKASHKNSELPKVYLTDVCKTTPTPSCKSSSPVECLGEKPKTPVPNGAIKMETVWVSDNEEHEKLPLEEEQNCFDPLASLCTKGIARGSKKSVKRQLKKIKGEKLDELLTKETKSSKLVGKVKNGKRSNKNLPLDIPKTSAERYRRRSEIRKLAKAARSAQSKWTNAELLRTMDAFVQLKKSPILKESVELTRVKVE